MRFRAGDRVQVSPDHIWAGGAIGTVSVYPDFRAQAPNQQRVDATTMSNSAFAQTVEETWVIFDEAQPDVDGDGPYTGGAVISSALTRLP
jgi:hypothetical protein